MALNDDRAERGYMVMQRTGYGSLADLLVDLAAYAQREGMNSLPTIAVFAQQRVDPTYQR